MKKNRTMRLAALLLVLTLITSCFVGGTFAKYTTSANSSDKARVAYWGFDDDADLAFDLFDGTYDAVDAENDDNVVAPGTSKTDTFNFQYTIKGEAVNALTAGKIEAPEVDYDFTVDFAVVGTGDYDALDDNPNFYWTLQKKGENVATKYQKVEQLEAAVEAMSGEADGTKRYTAGNLPESFTAADDVHTIGWEWVFEAEDKADTADVNEMAVQDATDTQMGNAQDLDDIEFKITITATQVDEP